MQSKLLIIFAVSALLPRAEELAQAMRQAKHRVLVRDAEAWLAHRDPLDTAPEVKADLALIPPGEQFDDLHTAFAMAVPDASVLREDPTEDLIDSARKNTQEADEDANAVAERERQEEAERQRQADEQAAAEAKAKAEAEAEAERQRLEAEHAAEVKRLADEEAAARARADEEAAAEAEAKRLADEQAAAAAEIKPTTRRSSK
jgi:colicin import membrane protein